MLTRIARGEAERTAYESYSALARSFLEEDCCGALSRPPLSCRTSPPQGGDWTAVLVFANHRRRRLAKSTLTANLPPCGGDVRQDRGGRAGATNVRLLAAACASQSTGPRLVGGHPMHELGPHDGIPGLVRSAK